jgi:cytidylate kinase
MGEVRVVLIGGTSNAGKSTVARALADGLGFAHRSTDGLARHPGRPWRTPEREVPAHVAEHYATLTVDELVESVLGHYQRLWPRIEELIAAHAAGGGTGPGLVLEGPAILPARVAELKVPRAAAVWLTADVSVVRARVRAAGRYDEADPAERLLMDRFVARAERFQNIVLEDVERLGLARVDTGDSPPVTALVDAVLAAVGGSGSAVGR